MRRRVVVVGLCGASLLACAGAAASRTHRTAECPNADVIPTASNLTAAVAATECLVNQARRQRHLPPLRRNAQLRSAALGHSAEMVGHRYFSHDDASGGWIDTRAEHAGYLPRSGPWLVGEALAWGVYEDAAPRIVVAAWLSSRAHRRTLLYSDFRQIGIGIVPGVPNNPVGDGATYTADLGARGSELTAARRKHHLKRRKNRHAHRDRCGATSTSAIDFCTG
jgi:uncharacterized protein YkwD